MVVVGTDLAVVAPGVDLASRHPDVFATVGLHPHDASRLDAEWDDLVALATSPRVVAVGEAGLRLPLHALAARRAGRGLPRADPPRARPRPRARDPFARSLGRDVHRARRRRRPRAHGVPLLHRRSRPKPTARSSSVPRSRSAASSRSSRPTTCAPPRRAAPPTASSSRPTRRTSRPCPYRGKENEPALIGAVGDALATAVGRDAADVAASTAAAASAWLELF